MKNATQKLFITFLISTSYAPIEAAPLIQHISWGKIIVTTQTANGETKAEFKDCKLSPNGARNWDWSKTGTRHKPGIQPSDLEDFIEEVDIVILSRGMDLVLQTKAETIELLRKKNKEFYILQTEQAAKLYNQLMNEGKRVGALIHSTC